MSGAPEGAESDATWDRRVLVDAGVPPASADRRSAAGGTPLGNSGRDARVRQDVPFPEHLDSRLRGNDGAEGAGMTKVDGTTPASERRAAPRNGRLPHAG